MTDKATNSHLFGGGKKRPSQPPYKRVEVATIAATYTSLDPQTDGTVHRALVLIRTGKNLYEGMAFGSFDTRLEALQRAHYINANMIMRTGDPIPEHIKLSERSLAEWKDNRYEV